MKVKHIEIVQMAVARMNHDSFLIKGWAITLVVAMLALSLNNDTPRFSILAIIPVAIFWVLDAVYLTQERNLRALHDKIADDIRNGTDVVPLFDMNVNPYRKPSDTIPRLALNLTIAPLYGVLTVVIVLVYIFNP